MGAIGGREAGLALPTARTVRLPRWTDAEAAELSAQDQLVLRVRLVYHGSPRSRNQPEVVLPCSWHPPYVGGFSSEPDP